MGRAIAAVVVGYLVMSVLVFAMFSGAYVTMGTDGAFRPGSYEVSNTWAAASIALGLLAAVAGGYTAAALGRRTGPVQALAVVVLVLGIVMAVPTLMAGPAPERTGAVANLEAMGQARTPAWLAFLNPLIGAAGVLAGGRLRLGSRAARRSERAPL